MMVQVLNNPTTSTYHAGSGNKKLWITIHQTSNWNKGADALMHATYMSGTGRNSATWHYTVDDERAVKHLSHDIRAYHAGDGQGNGNMNSIGIELCVNSDGDYVKTLENAAELVRSLMADENISLSNVVQHNHWSGKNCPIDIRAGKYGYTWNDFKRMIQGASVSDLHQTTTAPAGSIDDLAHRTIAGEFGVGEARKQNLGSRYSEVQRRVDDILLGNTQDNSNDIDKLADEVIAGKYSSGEERKRQLGNLYPKVQKRVNEKLQGKSSAPSKTTEKLAHEVIAGVYGSGEDRKKALGSRYQAVQNRVNEILVGGESSGKSTKQLADEVELGLHGDGDARKKSLGSRYNEVQAEINRRYS